MYGCMKIRILEENTTSPGQDFIGLDLQTDAIPESLFSTVPGVPERKSKHRPPPVPSMGHLTPNPFDDRTPDARRRSAASIACSKYRSGFVVRSLSKAFSAFFEQRIVIGGYNLFRLHSFRRLTFSSGGSLSSENDPPRFVEVPPAGIRV